MTNRLANETSPYLLQHSENPVDWFPWGEEALSKSKEEDKPILLSIGYAACHWCHVMEKECFENPKIAAIMNELFINIKVDRDERPDIDSIYMQALQAVTGQGGWPMTMFLTPELNPFYAGTYFPPYDTQHMPGFQRVLLSVSNAFITDRDKVNMNSIQITQHLQKEINIQPEKQNDTNILEKASEILGNYFDPVNGGVGSAPKFPKPLSLEFLLRKSILNNDLKAQEIVILTLNKMADGGIHDHIDGGFARYCTDAIWLTPHFEKMLYDNALLAKVFLYAYQLTNNPHFLEISEKIISYVTNDLTDELGGFYTSRDADSEGGEGTYYLWTFDEVMNLLGQKTGHLITQYFGITSKGNFENGNILHIEKSIAQLSYEQNLSTEIIENKINNGIEKMHFERNRRVKPPLDDKVLTSWNGMMLTTLAEAGNILNKQEYIDKAEKNANFLWDNLMKNGRLLRTWRQGQSKLLGYLEDYSHFAQGLIALYEATFNPIWIQRSIYLCDQILQLFYDPSNKTLYDTGNDHEELIIRPSEFFDGAIPCGASVATMVLLKLARLTGSSNYQNAANNVLEKLSPIISSQPEPFANWLCAIDFATSSPKEIAIIGDRNNSSTQEFLNQLRSKFIPNKVLAGFNNLLEEPPLPLLEDKIMVNNQPTAYICQNFTCNRPTNSSDEFKKQLEEVNEGLSNSGFFQID